MQSVSSSIWTRVAVSISYDDNYYTTSTSTYIYMCVCVCVCVCVQCAMGARVCMCVCDCKKMLLWIFLFIHTFFSPVISSNVHRYSNIFHEVLKRVITTEILNIDFHNKFLKFWNILLLQHISIYIYIYIYIYICLCLCLCV